MSEEKQPVRLSDLTLHDATAITVQRDPENGCIDIAIKGTDKYRGVRMTVYGVYEDDSVNIAPPTVTMLEDLQPEEEEEEEEEQP